MRDRQCLPKLDIIPRLKFGKLETIKIVEKVPEADLHQCRAKTDCRSCCEHALKENSDVDESLGEFPARVASSSTMSSIWVLVRRSDPSAR